VYSIVLLCDGMSGNCSGMLVCRGVCAYIYDGLLCMRDMIHK